METYGFELRDPSKEDMRLYERFVHRGNLEVLYFSIKYTYLLVSLFFFFFFLALFNYVEDILSAYCASTGMQVSTLVRLQANHLAANSLLRLPRLNWPCGKYVHYLQAAFSFGLGSIYTPAFVLSSLGSQGT